MAHYIFKYIKDEKTLGYHLDTFCSIGPMSKAKMYKCSSDKIKELTEEKQKQVNWHVSMGSMDLKDVTVIAEKVTDENFPHENYTMKKSEIKYTLYGMLLGIPFWIILGITLAIFG